jgi:hypothetical protein
LRAVAGAWIAAGPAQRRVTEKGVGTAQLDPVAIRQRRRDLVENGERKTSTRKKRSRGKFCARASCPSRYHINSGGSIINLGGNALWGRVE